MSNIRTILAITLFAAVGCKIEATLPKDAMGSSASDRSDSELVTPEMDRAGHAAPPATAGRGAGSYAGHGAVGHAARGDDSAADDRNPLPNDEAQPADESVPADLVGAWYAGSGHTSIPYDPVTGASGTPNGNGLLYRFSADGAYQKAFQSSASNGGCMSGFVAVEQGRMQVIDQTLYLAPDEGHIRYSDTCAPSLDSDKPIDDLVPETFSWTFTADGLLLTRSDGATSVFVPAEW